MIKITNHYLSVLPSNAPIKLRVLIKITQIRLNTFDLHYASGNITINKLLLLIHSNNIVDVRAKGRLSFHPKNILMFSNRKIQFVLIIQI